MTKVNVMTSISHMNINQEIQNLSDSINNAVYCELLDLDTDPGSAWDATFNSNFSLSEDAELYPVNGELV